MPNEEVNISELCRLIRDSVGDAVTKAARSSEMQEIKDAVRSVVREVADELGTTARTTGETVRDSVKRSAENAAKNVKQAGNYNYTYNYVYKTPEPTPEVSGPPVWKGSTQSMVVKGNLMSIFGVIGAIGALGVTALVGSIALKLIADVTSAVAFGLFSLIPIGAAVAFVAMATRGSRMRGMASRYKQYIATIGNDSFCALNVLGEKVGKSLRYVQKDIKRMIKAGMFPEGQLDREKTTLILDNETYKHYQEVQQKVVQPEPKAEETEEPTEISKVLAEGKEYIRRMRLANDLISGQEMSAKIDRMERVGLRIFEHVEQNPSKLPVIRRFMSYYLPITIKLLESYAKFDNQPVQGENITTAKREIEETLDTITVAFENLLDNLFDSEVMDISSDISALSAMLAQEGLTGSDFKTAAEPTNDKI